MRPWATVLGAVLLFALATSASAECAWVLWTKDSALATSRGEWSYTAFGLEVFETRAECEKVALTYRANRLKSYEDAKKAVSRTRRHPPRPYSVSPTPWTHAGRKGSDGRPNS